MLEKLLRDLSKRYEKPFRDVRKEFFADYRIFKRLYPYATKDYSVRYIISILEHKYKRL